MQNILIIGAGYSGAAVAARLLTEAGPREVTVMLANGSGGIARGMAYGTQSPDHSLNVPAGNMSAYDDDPDHFLRFAAQADNTVSAASFVSRRIYGDYLESILEQAESSTALGNKLERIHEYVTHIADSSGDVHLVVTLESGKTLAVDKVVLALGHFPSINPWVTDSTFYANNRYIRDPWDQSKIDAIPTKAPVMLVGTGLTAVDVAMTLLNQNPQRQIIAVSRRGLLPQYHRHSGGKPLNQGAHVIWGGATTVRKQMRRFREYCQGLAAQGRDWREGLALLRPVTADIWLAYSEKERRRFLRHVQPYWDTHRHRLAPSVAERFDAALTANVVRTMAGRILGYKVDGDNVEVSVQLRGTDDITSAQVQYVINCTGPCADPRRVNSPLVQQLLRQGLIRTDELGLGIDVAEDCAVLNADGKASTKMFYIGPWLKANYWEATAVPDLRVFARKLAQRLIQDSPAVASTM